MSHNNGKKTFTLKFESYVQEVQWVEVQANSLDEAMELAQAIDTDDLEDWEYEVRVDHPRLYGVKDGAGEWVYEVDLSHHWGKPLWTQDCARDQWLENKEEE